MHRFSRSSGDAWTLPAESVSAEGANLQPATASTTDVDFDEFYRTERPSLVRALAMTLGDADLAAEAVDEAMTRAFQRWPAVWAMSKPSGWVYQVALNWARSALRSQRRRRSRVLHEREAVDDTTNAGDDAVRAALSALDVKHRAVVVCRYLLDFSEEETATILRLPVGTVKSRLHRAARQLRSQLEHFREEDDR